MGDYMLCDRLFIFSYNDMNVGGIQKIVYNYIKFFTRHQVDVLWIAPKKCYVDDGFKEELKKIRIVNHKLSDDDYGFIKSHKSISYII